MGQVVCRKSNKPGLKKEIGDQVKESWRGTKASQRGTKTRKLKARPSILLTRALYYTIIR